MPSPRRRRARWPVLALAAGIASVLALDAAVIAERAGRDAEVATAGEPAPTGRAPRTTTTTTTVSPSTSSTATATGDSTPRGTPSKRSGDATVAPPTTQASASSSGPTRGPSIKGSIVFASDDGPPKVPTTGPVTPGPQGLNIWTMRADGSGKRVLTSTQADAQPDLSPDGRSIVWVRWSSEVWTMGSDGSGKQRVAACPVNCQDPRWSPEGSQLVYVESTADTGDIVVVDADGSDARRYTSGVDHYAATWSPDGRRLAFTGYGNDNGLYTLDLATGREQRLTQGHHHGISWSPDGSLLLFGDEYSALSVIHPDGTGQRRIIGGPGVIGSIGATPGQFLRGDWSADGRTIVVDYYSGNAGVQGQVGMVNADGSGFHTLTDGSHSCYEASF